MGYPMIRADELKGQIVSAMVDNIAKGNKFYLPGLLKQTDDPTNSTEGVNEQ